MQKKGVYVQEKNSKGDWVLLNQRAGDDACVPSFWLVAIAVADLGTQPHLGEVAVWIIPRLELLCRSYSQAPIELI